MKRFNYMINYYIFTLSIIIAIFIANMIFAKFDARFDVTQNKSNSLAKESLSTLENLNNLEGTVKILFFTSPQNDVEADISERTKVLLEQLSHNSKKVEYEIINPLKEKLKAQEYEIMYSSEIVIEYNDKKSKISPNQLFTMDQFGKFSYFGERVLIQKIFDMTQKGDYNIYFTFGHNEASTMNELSNLSSFLQGQGIGINSIDLTRDDIAENTSALFIVSPKSDFTDEELMKIDHFLSKGGNLLVTLPIYDKKYTLDNLQTFMKNKGITIENNIVLDPIRHYTTSPEIVVATYGAHEVTEVLTNQKITTLAIASRSLTINEDSDYIITSLLNTSEKAWGETLNKGTEKEVSQDKNELSGVLSLAAAMEKEVSENQSSRIIVLGSPTFVTNEYGEYFNAMYPFFLNTLHWLDESNVVLDIPLIETPTKEIRISKGQSDFIFLSIVVVIPAIIMTWGFALWYTRRYR